MSYKKFSFYFVICFITIFSLNMSAHVLTADAHATNVKLDKITTSSMRLSWSDVNSNEKKWVIERSTDGKIYTAVNYLPATVSGSVVYYTGVGMKYLAPGTRYWYRVAGLNEFNMPTDVYIYVTASTLSKNPVYTPVQ